MANRVGRYLVEDRDADLTRALDTMRFCYALIRLGEARDFASWELNALASLQANATAVFRKYGLPAPWLTSNAK
ncbi:MAG TPA: hypothetical protein VHD36_19380 [Pirellulales bacterium]|nr:hypothetical protein [Pirellulales bacterium]